MQAPHLKEGAVALEADIEHLRVRRRFQHRQQILERLRLPQPVGFDLGECRSGVDDPRQRNKQRLDMIGNVDGRALDEIDGDFPRQIDVSNIERADDGEQQRHRDQCKRKADADPERKAETAVRHRCFRSVTNGSILRECTPPSKACVAFDLTRL